MPSEDVLLTSDIVMEELGLSWPTVKGLIESGQLAAIKVGVPPKDRRRKGKQGRLWRFRRSAVDALLASGAYEPKARALRGEKGERGKA